MADEQNLKDFIGKYAKPYDPETDSYERPPFAADIKEGKNDPIYNAHSYHTKVPPRGSSRTSFTTRSRAISFSIRSAAQG